MSFRELDTVKALRREAGQLRSQADRISKIADGIETTFHAAAQMVDGPTAIDTLRQQVDIGQAAHYRTFYEVLSTKGIIPRGEQPLATLLTALTRSEHFRRVGPARSGRYERIS